ncbi:protein spaetzle [Anopheles nili]|uniref:protein spaetzle n=1 Tax=Anopheles nili TaxID=185578 RepID=UPI00237A7747|nr:protein spaetzle [Anopheles nili]
MAPCHGCYGLIILFTLQLVSATSQSFGPLIRNRSIHQLTSEEDLNANIQRIYRKDFKAPSTTNDPLGDQIEPSPSELVVRDSLVSKRKQPIGKNEQYAILSVMRNPSGKLEPVFGNTTLQPTTKHTPYEHVVSTSAKQDEILVLRASTENDPLNFQPGSYPEGYPFEAILKILNEKKNLYQDVFEPDVKISTLVTRIDDSEPDDFVCKSVRSDEYPTYHASEKAIIVNIAGHFQNIVFETCVNTNAPCSNATTDANSALVCEQVYQYQYMYVVPATDQSKFERKALRFPSCCKCRHVPKSALSSRSGP